MSALVEPAVALTFAHHSPSFPPQIKDILNGAYISDWQATSPPYIAFAELCKQTARTKPFDLQARYNAPG